LPWLQVCRSCLREDFAIGTQFLRIRWLSAASSFCPRHREPLQTPCTACRGANSFYCRRIPPRFVFVCAECDGTLDSGRYDMPIDLSAARLLMQFEAALESALDGWAPDPSWVGGCTAKQFLTCIEDLVWTLTWPMADWFGSPAPIKWFQVKAVPLVWRFQAYRSIRHQLARSSVWLRRALLAAALGVLCEEARRILNVGPLDVRFRRDLPALCDLLHSSVRESLLRRARDWPRQLKTELMGKVGPASPVYSLRQKSTNYG
jgi:hypothetical protein